MSVLKLNQIQTASGVIMANLNSSGANVGIQLASNLAPAFQAYKSGSQTISHNVDTKVTFDTENYDTNNNFASSTFTPTVAGYYNISCSLPVAASANRQFSMFLSLRKNGTQIYQPEVSYIMGSSMDRMLLPFNLTYYANGTGDYFEVYFTSYDYTTSASVTVTGGSTKAQFSAFLVRSA
jgi:hypothetical protein